MNELLNELLQMVLVANFFVGQVQSTMTNSLANTQDESQQHARYTQDEFQQQDSSDIPTLQNDILFKGGGNLGDCKLHFVYKRSWEKSPFAKKTLAIQVREG